MNIFATHQSAYQSALWLDDKRALQLLRETGQMLSTAVHQVDRAPPEGLYKPFGVNHPCNVWVRSSRVRFAWLLQHGQALASRTDKHDRAKEVLAVCRHWLSNNHFVLPREGLLPFANCAANEEKGISFKELPDTVAAYRIYLNHRWATDARPPTWNTGEQPYWYRDLRR